MSEILAQNITLIYYFIKQAVSLTFEGYSWKGLDMLRTAAALCYKDEKTAKDLDKIKTVIITIQKESEQITGASAETRQARIADYQNARARAVFNEELEGLRDYMQNVGYYAAMNKGWTDPSGGRKSA